MSFLRMFPAVLLAFTALSSSAIAAEPAEGHSASTIVLAGGCFWGMEAVFEHVKGVKEVMPGYAGGGSTTAHYGIVSTGATGHAESVEVTYDPKEVTLEQLLKVYFVAAHNPTELNFQTPDHGTQYRSAIFFATPEQKKEAESVMDDLQQKHAFSAPIVTKLEPLKQFYPAEDYHRHYFDLHPDNPYIVTYDAPRVANVKKDFPELYTDKHS